MDRLPSRLDTCGSTIYTSLVCSEEALRQRLHIDVVNGVRIRCYRPQLQDEKLPKMDTSKVDTMRSPPKRLQRRYMRVSTQNDRMRQTGLYASSGSV